MTLNHNTRILYLLTILMLFITSNTNGMIVPISRDGDGNPLLTNCADIRLVSQQIDLYHHPLGIWIVKCSNELQNMYPKQTKQEVGFPSGLDINKFDEQLYCDAFDGFRVVVDGTEIDKIKMLEKCSNYVERIGNQWTQDENSGIGYLNTWNLEFGQEAVKQVDIYFSFVLKKPNIHFDRENNQPWYREATSWLKQEYYKKAENEFEFHLNLGSFWASIVDTLFIRSYYSDNWFLLEDEHERKYDQENIDQYTYSEPIGFYSPPAMDEHEMDEAFLTTLSQTELRVLKNAFLAKYGKIFQKKYLKLYFEQQDWYVPDPGFDIWYLTERDIDKMKLIYSCQQKKANNVDK